MQVACSSALATIVEHLGELAAITGHQRGAGLVFDARPSSLARSLRRRHFVDWGKSTLSRYSQKRSASITTAASDRRAGRASTSPRLNMMPTKRGFWLDLVNPPAAVRSRAGWRRRAQFVAGVRNRHHSQAEACLSIPDLPVGCRQAAARPPPGAGQGRRASRIGHRSLAEIALPFASAAAQVADGGGRQSLDHPRLRKSRAAKLAISTAIAHAASAVI